MIISLRCSLCFLLLGISFSAFSQANDGYFLKWKLKPGEVIAYKTNMEEIDTAHHKDFSMEGMMKSIGVDSDFTTFNKTMKQLNKEMENAGFITYLKAKRRGIVDIEMVMKQDSAQKKEQDISQETRNLKEAQAMMMKMSRGVVLRGAMYDDGTIESFYTKGEQKNLISMFFELPGRKIKLGDSWALNMNFISMDQNFICDSSYKKNNVKVIQIESRNNEHIITLKYDILEFVRGDFGSPFSNEPVKTMMKMTYNAVAEFSLEKGRWVSYNGVMSLTATGIMTSQTTKKFALVEE